MPAGDLFDRPVFARARRICLGYPEAVEAVAWGHPVFKAGKKTFCAFEMLHGRPSIAFRLYDHPETKVQIRGKPGHRADTFFFTPYGRNQWVSVWADGPLDWKMVERMADQGYRLVANKRLLARLDAAPRGGYG